MLKTAEGCLKKESSSALVVGFSSSSSKNKSQTLKKKKKNKNQQTSAEVEKPEDSVKKKNVKGICFHCGEAGHKKRNYKAYLASFKEKKLSVTSPSGLFMIEVNLSTSVSQSWVLDTGCGCDAYIKRAMSDKLEAKSDKCMFVGYPKESFGYQFYHPLEQKVFVSRHAIFLEREFILKECSGSNVELRESDQDDSRSQSGYIFTLCGGAHYWKTKIEGQGREVSNSAIGVNCLVVSPAGRERGGSSKLAEALERGIPVVREAWLLDSFEKQEPQPLEAYDCVSDLADPSDEAFELISAERGVHRDTKLQERGGQIFERDGILYNCAFALCDMGRGQNEFCVMQLITVPESNLHLYYKKGGMGDDINVEERLEEWENMDKAIKEFIRLFEEFTGNEFEPWEREKKFEKKRLSFYPIDMDLGVDVRHGGVTLRQLGVAAAHCKLEPMVANFMKILIFVVCLIVYMPQLRWLWTLLSNLHLERGEEVLQQFVEVVKESKETGQKAEAVWSDFSQRWFTLMPSTRPFIDINVASHLIGDMSGSTLDYPLSDRYNKLGCSVSTLDEDSDDYKMMVKYLETTYEPFKVGDIEYGISIENIFAAEVDACPSLDEMENKANRILLWCGTRSSNLLRHLHKGFLPAVCSLPVAGYMFGKAIVCSDAAAEAARYGFTAVDRADGFLVLAVASLGDQIMEVKSPPEEEKKIGVKGLGQPDRWDCACGWILLHVNRRWFLDSSCSEHIGHDLSTCK
ncbi:hypothetical protein K2173_013832 [Erythroxylum novogranatense]|uniref:Poly [ADP-ribose] polymerase n=1 Tax=Erythroxylum novogranatense TaxID=1862640 RepID=A0AAV8SCG4_9ROSI|nr:hypothetical protein K2173_013832 [Erythroxylum novogranatense]